MASKTLSSAIAISLLAGSSALMAAGTGVQAGPFRVKPTIGLTFAHDSNVTLAKSNEISSFVTQVSPGIRFDAGNEQRSFSLSYEMEAARYADSAAKRSDYTDHLVSAGVKLSPSARSVIQLGADYTRGHDRIGENARQGTLANFQNLDADRFRVTGAHGGFTFGSPEARMNIGFLAGLKNQTYINNRSYTIFGDRDENFVEGRFGWRFAPKTSVFVSARNNDIDFDRDRRSAGGQTVSLDSSERVYLLGLQFDATAKTSGRIAVGRSNKQFDDSRVRDYSGTAWDVGVQFKPRSYSVFDLSASRRTDEGVDFISAPGISGDTAYVLARDVTLAWTHGWSDRLHTTIDVGNERSGYFNYSGSEPRSDTFNFFGVSADYALNSWLSLGAGYKNYSRNSNASVAQGTGFVDVYDYDRDEFLISFEGSL